MPSLPTRAELALRFDAFERKEGPREQIAAVLVVAALWGNIPLFRWLDRNPGMAWIAAVVIFMEFAPALVFMARASTRARDAEVCCPSCGATFMRPEARQLVVATGYCGQCSAAVAQDAPGADASFVVPSRADPRAESRRRTALYVVTLAVCVFAAFNFWHRGAAARRATTFVHANAPLAGVTVQEAAASIAATRGRPSIVIIYTTRCRLSPGMFTAFAEMAARHPEVDVHAFGSDERYANEIPAFLREHGADFSPLYLRDWRTGELIAALDPLGIEVKTLFSTPLVAIRDKDGYVVMQGEAMTDVKRMEGVLERLR
jgi:hypothetical protein